MKEAGPTRAPPPSKSLWTHLPPVVDRAAFFKTDPGKRPPLGKAGALPAAESRRPPVPCHEGAQGWTLPATVPGDHTGPIPTCPGGMPVVPLLPVRPHTGRPTPRTEPDRPTASQAPSEEGAGRRVLARRGPQWRPAQTKKPSPPDGARVSRCHPMGTTASATPPQPVPSVRILPTRTRSARANPDSRRVPAPRRPTGAPGVRTHDRTGPIPSPVIGGEPPRPFAGRVAWRAISPRTAAGLPRSPAR